MMSETENKRLPQPEATLSALLNIAGIFIVIRHLRLADRDQAPFSRKKVLDNRAQIEINNTAAANRSSSA